jgi:hypothetical protein
MIVRVLLETGRNGTIVNTEIMLCVEEETGVIQDLDDLGSSSGQTEQEKKRASPAPEVVLVTRNYYGTNKENSL